MGSPVMTREPREKKFPARETAIKILENFAFPPKMLVKRGREQESCAQKRKKSSKRSSSRSGC
jgi:hypothetical protein